MKNKCILILIIFISGFSAFSDSLEFKAAPYVSLPVAESADYYNVGYGANLDLFWSPFQNGIFGLSGGLGYSALPTQAETLLSAFRLQLGGGVRWQFLPRLTLGADLQAGLYYGIYETLDALNAAARGAIQLDFTVTDAFSFGAGADYSRFFTSETSLYDGVGVSIMGTVKPSGVGASPKIDLKYIESQPVFPVFYKWYDTNTFGNGTLKNSSTSTLKNIRVQVFINEFMDTPKDCISIAQVKPGDTVDFPVFALFKDSILTVTEKTKVAGEIVIEYEALGNTYRTKKNFTIDVYDRNAITWSDDRRAASFVTAKDPSVLQFAKEIAGGAREYHLKAGDKNFRSAMAIFIAMQEYGMKYIVDPVSSYESLSGDESAVDYLQFPRQTLQYRSGDCDDLTILYCALLESVGIKTAFITVPGHIYPAFALSISEDEAGKTFRNGQENLIFDHEQVWVPVEITMLNSGFVDAWQKGAGEWMENAENASIYSIHDAWKTYESVGIREELKEIKVPLWNDVKVSYGREIDRYIASELDPQIKQIESRMASIGSSPRLENRIGTLYARYGKLDEAGRIFKKIIEKDNFLPSYNNLANVYYLQEDYSSALLYFNKAESISPDQRTIIAGRIKTLKALNRFTEADEQFNRLLALYPEYEKEYSLLSGNYANSDRAGESELPVEWDD